MIKKGKRNKAIGKKLHSNHEFHLLSTMLSTLKALYYLIFSTKLYH